MKHAVVKGSLYGVGATLVELVFILLGIITLDSSGTTGPIKDATYIPCPNWVFLAVPICVGLAAFLWTWNQDIEENGKRSKKS
jgi:hypothetical protein